MPILTKPMRFLLAVALFGVWATVAQGAECPVVVYTAPTADGKTTLVSLVRCPRIEDVNSPGDGAGDAGAAGAAGAGGDACGGTR